MKNLTMEQANKMSRKNILLYLIAQNQEKIDNLSLDEMSKTGVKWIKSVCRDNIRRFKNELSEIK
jgi:hypothetical protein